MELTKWLKRVFQTVMEGVIAEMLLVGGGLATLQTTSVSTSLPFAFVLLISVNSLYVGFSQETYVENAVKHAVSTAKEGYRVQEAITSAIENGEDAPSN